VVSTVTVGSLRLLQVAAAVASEGAAAETVADTLAQKGPGTGTRSQVQAVQEGQGTGTQLGETRRLEWLRQIYIWQRSGFAQTFQ
jgi:hypothetical protein